MKKLYAETDNATTELLGSMANDVTYETEKKGYEKVVEKLQAAVQKAKASDEFFAPFLLKKFAHTKEPHDADTLTVKLTEIVTIMDKPVKDLTKKVNEILLVVQARLKAGRTSENRGKV